jgi:preprotein translocase subunit SecB
MADEGMGETQGNGQDLAPQVGIITQYVKDLSFENPNAPAVYQWQGQPQIDVQFNFGSTKVAEDVYEVVLKAEIKAVSAAQTAFQVELTYGTLFALRNVPPEQLQPFLFAEAPRLIFPFVRRIVADAVRDGGFPPLMLEPIDFPALYLAQLQQQEQAAGMGEPQGEA